MKRNTAVSYLRRVAAPVGVAIALIFATVTHAAGTIEVTDSQPYGTFTGVEFTQSDCRFVGSADSFVYTTMAGTGAVDYDVFCRIILPNDPDRWNGKILVYPYQQLDRPLSSNPDEADPNLRLLFTNDLLFGQMGDRWGYAAISWTRGVPADLIDQPVVIDPFGEESLPAAGLEIIADFAEALRSGSSSPIGSGYGYATHLVGHGQSNTAHALRGVLALWPDFGARVFDASLLMNSFGSFLAMDPTRTGLVTVPLLGPPTLIDFGAERILDVETEHDYLIDLVFLDGSQYQLLCNNEIDNSNRFLYEIAGGSHIPPVYFGINAPLVGLTPDQLQAQANPLDWSPIMRALLVAADKWITDGTPPPPSQIMDSSVADDRVHGFPTGLARDANNNALGGVRLPDVELGTGQFASTDFDALLPDFSNFLLWLHGSPFTDLSCEPLLDGSDRFKNHGDYVRRFEAETKKLQQQGLVLKADAKAMNNAAAHSDIGKC